MNRWAPTSCGLAIGCSMAPRIRVRSRGSGHAGTRRSVLTPRNSRRLKGRSPAARSSSRNHLPTAGLGVPSLMYTTNLHDDPVCPYQLLPQRPDEPDLQHEVNDATNAASVQVTAINTFYRIQVGSSSAAAANESMSTGLHTTPHPSATPPPQALRPPSAARLMAQYPRSPTSRA